jgi:hypothetical protein
MEAPPVAVDIGGCAPPRREESPRMKHRESQRRYYEGNKHNIQKYRFLRRAAEGAITKLRRAVLEKYGVTQEEVNAIREDNGLPPLPVAVTYTPNPNPKPKPRPVEVEKPLPADVEKTVVEKILALEGTPQLDTDRKAKRNKKLLTKGTVKNYATAFSSFVAPLLSESLNGNPMKAGDIIKHIEDEYSNVNTRKNKLNAIVALAKYIPEIRGAMGPVLDELRDRMGDYIEQAKKEAVEKSGNETVEDMQSIRKRVEDEVKKNFGELSREYIAARLQTRLVGLRGELGTVQVFKNKRGGRFDKAKNAYNRATGKLKIENFKTKQDFDPYLFTLSNAQRELLERWFDKHPEYTHLFGTDPTPIGPILKRALNLSVMPIRHSMVSHELNKGDPSREHIEKVAKMFRHSPEMTTTYFRGSPPEDDVDEE